MKRSDFAIGILLIVVVAQLVLSTVLLKKVNQLRLRICSEDISVPEYVFALSERVEQTHALALKFARQADWLGKRLDKCMEQLESQLQLEPMTDKSSVDFSFPQLGPYVSGKMLQQPEPFYVPYEYPNKPPVKNLTQHQLRKLVCMANLQQVGLHMTSYCLGPKIENLDKRLRRLDEELASDTNSAGGG